ncbi:MAG: hypothetical protein IPP72_21780 [Chitinophagaceae bacterium]|nr:hypothetical protein [Chitinophagaceae bacterium]
MKKSLQAAALIILATSAVVAAASSRHSRANKYYPNEWESSYRSAVPDSFFINYSKSINK